MTARDDNGFYRSELIESVDWHAGVRMTERFFRFIRFYADGFYVMKSAPARDFDFPGFLATLDLERIKRDHPQNPPTDPEGDPLYQVGRFTEDGGTIHLTQWGTLRWELTVVSPEWLAAGATRFEFVTG